MAFSREPTRTPVAIGNIEIRLYDPDPAEMNQRGADFAVVVRFDDGEVKVMRGDLVPHLSQAQINALLGFVADMRTKAETEILP